MRLVYLLATDSKQVFSRSIAGRCSIEWIKVICLTRCSWPHVCLQPGRGPCKEYDARSLRDPCRSFLCRCYPASPPVVSWLDPNDFKRIERSLWLVDWILFISASFLMVLTIVTGRFDIDSDHFDGSIRADEQFGAAFRSMVLGQPAPRKSQEYLAVLPGAESSGPAIQVLLHLNCHWNTTGLVRSGPVRSLCTCCIAQSTVHSGKGNHCDDWGFSCPNLT